MLLLCPISCKQRESRAQTLAGSGLYVASRIEKTFAGTETKYGFIDRRGDWAIGPQFDDACSFNDDLAAVLLEGKWGFIHKDGTFAIHPSYAELPYDFSEGFARCRVGQDKHFIDQKGNNPFTMSFAGAKPFRQNRAFVKFRGDPKWSLIDRTGAVVVSNQFDSCSVTFGDEGLASVQMEGLWGFVDDAGAVVIECQFRYASVFSDGLARVAPMGSVMLYGFIDRTGKMVIPAEFSRAQDFSDGYAAVRQGDNWGYIDVSGEFAIAPQFPSSPSTRIVAASFREGMARVCRGGKFGFIDKKGKWVVEPTYDMADPFVNGLAMVILREGRAQVIAYIDRTGREVWRERLGRDVSRGDSLR